MKVIAYTALHYGVEYLPWALRSVQNAVDEIHILYSPKPSYGHGTDLPCPETEGDLRIAASKFIKKPLYWHTGDWNGEGNHRHAILEIAQKAKADLIVWVDADEVWDHDSLLYCLNKAYQQPAKEFRVKFIHFWKSFKWTCTDPCMPVRIVNPNGAGTEYIHQPLPVLHFGYALKPATVFYKQAIHGHKSEWKPGWFDKTYMGWKEGEEDVHPTCGRNERNEAFWIPRPTPPDVRVVLKEQMYDHPYYGLDRIE
jgi:hypothetical protein